MILAVDELRVQYRSLKGPVHAVDGANLVVPAGQIMGLVGESGCGKTTLARAIIGVLPKNARIVSGSITFAGQDLVKNNGKALHNLRWRDIAFIPQSAMNSLDPVYRVRDQLAEVLIERGNYSKSQAGTRAAELFDLVGLDPTRLTDYPHQFSGGMRQRVAIALALALAPKLVIADEPVTALDVIVQRQILDTFKNLQRQLGVSVLLVTHDISVVAYVCDQVAVMYAGQVIESGSVATVLRRPYHPYTMGLYNAFPDLERATHELTPIEGSPPDLLIPPSGCRFEPRCPFSVAECKKPPALWEVEPAHVAACWRAQDAPKLREQAAKVSTWQRY